MPHGLRSASRRAARDALREQLEEGTAVAAVEGVLFYALDDDVWDFSAVSEFVPDPPQTVTLGTFEGHAPTGAWSLVPRYRDGSRDDGDTFVFSGAEDLVPVSEPEPGVTRFRPRTEGLFARIDRVRTGRRRHLAGQHQRRARQPVRSRSRAGGGGRIWTKSWRWVTRDTTCSSE